MKTEKILIPIAVLIGIGATYFIYTKVEEHKTNKIRKEISKDIHTKKEIIKPKAKEYKSIEEKLLSDERYIIHDQNEPVILGKQKKECEPREMTKQEYLDTLRHKVKSKLIIHAEDEDNSFTIVK